MLQVNLLLEPQLPLLHSHQILNLQTQPQTTKQPFSDFGRAESPIHKVNNGEDYALVGKAVYQMADYVY